MEPLHELDQIKHDVVVFNAACPVSCVDAVQLSEWMKDEDIFMVDLREPEDYEESRIAGAFLLPMSRLDAGSFPRVPGLKTVLVCQSGFLAPIARDDLINAGFENIYVLDGGLGAWTAAGFEIDE